MTMAASTEQKIPAGYKQTEVGIIPEDWDVRKLGELLKQPPKYGINAAAVKYSDSLPTYIRITDISEDGRFLPQDKTSVNHDLANDYYLEDGDVVFARTGASVGKTYLYNTKDGKLVFAGFLIRVKPNPDKLNAKYLSNFTKTKSYWNWVQVMSMRSGQPGINGNEYKQLTIILPSIIKEQDQIVCVLSDVDILIEKLEILIKKKKNIKQGTMQELLTGKKRLPGFEKQGGFKKTEIGEIPKDWDFKRIDEIFTISAGRDLIKDSFSAVRDDSHPFPIYSNSLDNKGLYGYTKISRYKENCITITARGTIGRANARDHKFDAIGRLLVLEPKIDLNCYFLSEYINNLVIFSIESTGVPQLTAPQSSQYIVVYPLPKEQSAIAKVLSDMDSEIEKLESQLTKYRNIKQGMMQNLLTGKIRLNKK